MEQAKSVCSKGLLIFPFLLESIDNVYALFLE